MQRHSRIQTFTESRSQFLSLVPEDGRIKLNGTGTPLWEGVYNERVPVPSRFRLVDEKARTQRKLLLYRSGAFFIDYSF